MQLLCLTGLVVVDGIILATRAANGQNFIEEGWLLFRTCELYPKEAVVTQNIVIELGYWLLLLLLFAFRFYPTPYRPSLFLLVALWCIVPPILTLQRDLWPKVLYNPSPEKSHDARTGWSIYARAGLAVSVELCALFTPRFWYAVDPYSNDHASPEQTASLMSYVGSYSWIGYLVGIAWWRDLEPEDLPSLPDYDRARLWSKKVENNKRATTFKTFFACMRWDVLYMTICSFLIGVVQFVWPVSMRELLAYVEGSKVPVVNPWVFVFGLFFGPLLTGLIWEAYVYNATRYVSLVAVNSYIEANESPVDWL